MLNLLVETLGFKSLRPYNTIVLLITPSPPLVAHTTGMTHSKVQEFCTVLRLRLCFVYGPHNKQLLLPHKTSTDWICITEVESVYYAVRAESLYKTDTFHL
jgi:hypothetical protein